MNRLLLIDGNSLTYRGYYATAYGYNGILKSSDGTPTNAILALNNMLTNAISNLKPTHILIAFDMGKKTFRHKQLTSYKAGRSKTPKELIVQFPLVKEMIAKMGIKYFEKSEIEADDIIGTLATWATKDTEVNVMSSDKDLYQLVKENVNVLMNKSGVKDIYKLTINNFFSELNYLPSQVPDMKGLVGDTSDNLPGVKGIGEKGAIKLLSKFKTLEGVYENIEEIKGSTKEKLIKDKDMAFLCKDIATLKCDVEIPFILSDLEFTFSTSQELIDFFNKYELASLVKKYQNKLSKNTYGNILI